MPRKKSITLTNAELRIMKIIWELKEATVKDVLQALSDEEPLAYNTVLTIMRILEDKGHLGRTKRGRAHVYIPKISQTQAQYKAMKYMVYNFFNDSPDLLLQSVLRDESLTSEDITRLKEMINKF